MKKLLAITGLLLGSLFARSQPLADLIEDVQAHKTSITGLRALFSKHPSYIDESDSRLYNEALLGQRMEKANFHYTLADSITHDMNVLAIYQNEQVHYIKIEGMRYDSNQKQEAWQVVYRYIDTLYTNQVLARYNKKHQTDFTWQDLYEDPLHRYDNLPELFEPLIDPAEATEEDYAQGKVRAGLKHGGPPYSTSLFRPLLINRDHAAIVRSARSFNPVRKAYGGYCLFILEGMGEKLSAEEKQLFRSIAQSKEIIPVYFEDMGSLKPISSIFIKKDLKNFAAYYKDFKRKGGQF